MFREPKLVFLFHRVYSSAEVFFILSIQDQNFNSPMYSIHFVED